MQVIEIYSHQLLKYKVDRLLKQTKKFLFHKIIPRAGSNHATGRIWPAGRMFDTPAVKFLVWENTTRKELQPLELTNKLTTEFAYNGTSIGDCIKNIIAELTIWHYKRIEMHVNDAIATKQNVTLWVNWRSRRSRYERIQLYRTDLHKVSGSIRIKLKSYFQGKLFIFRANRYF